MSGGKVWGDKPVYFKQPLRVCFICVVIKEFFVVVD